MTTLTLALLVVAAMLVLAGRNVRVLHLLQLEHYEFSRLRVWIARRRERALWRELAAIVAAGVLAAVALAVAAGLGLGLAVVAVVAGALTLRAVTRRPQAKPLVFTARARRLLAASLALDLLVLLGVALAPPLAPALLALLVCAVAVIAHVLAPEALLVADRLLGPLQRFDNRRYVTRASRRLAEVNPLVVGITGSYGKTTTKAYAAAVLDLLGPSCPTPASFNSYLGVVRAINEQLRPQHRSFVVEMGAYRAGDIAELCELVSPRIGILTSIGSAHLERFGSLDAIAAAKTELGASLPADGTFITRADDERCRTAASGLACAVALFSPQAHPDADVWAERVTFEQGATRLELCVRQGDEIVRVAARTRLLGSHNVANLLAAATLGVVCGLAPSEIAAALAAVRAPPHRLAAIVNREAGLVVIDDAYNANPDGFAAALAVLADHPAQRRILVTPGMVELGDLHDVENRDAGSAAADVCDLVILTGGENSHAVRAGLELARFPAEAIYEVHGSSGAADLLAQVTRRGDVILFENDLPDTYLAPSGASVTDSARQPQMASTERLS